MLQTPGVFQMADQPTEHLVDSFDLIIKRRPAIFIQIAEFLGDFELGIQLAGGTLRHVKEVNEFFLGLPSGTFSDVGWNAESGSSYLARQAEPLMLRKSICCTING